MGLQHPRTDRAGYDRVYKDQLSSLITANGLDEYVTEYERRQLSPFFRGGTTKGYVRGLAIRKMIERAAESGRDFRDVTVLDAGAGLGELSVYLAGKGFNVIGVDISESGVTAARHLAESLGVTTRCSFLARSLEQTGLESDSIDFIVGLASLHHIIKYDKVPAEFTRLLKKNGEGFFADSFGENRLYHLFHDKKLMQELGDVVLTKQRIMDYFEDFDVDLTPADWFVMLDKFLLRLLPESATPLLRGFSRLLFATDRRIPAASRVSLMLSGSVLTHIRKS